MPYSDPMMDGVTIQRAGTRALARGVRTRDAFAAVEAVAATGTPAVVMTYWNLIERYGPDALRPGPGRRRRVRRDHPGPDPGRGRGVDRRLRRPRPGPDLPGVAVLHRRADRRARSRPAAAGCTRPSVMGVTGARAQTSSAAPDAGRPDPAAPTRTPWSGSGSASPTASRPAR